MSAPRTCVRCFVFITILFCFLDLEPLIDYQHCKKQKTPKENPQDLSTKKECLGPGLSSEALVFLSLCLIAVFCFWIRKPPSATRTRTAKNTKTPEENQKNHKKNQNVWAQDFLQRLEIFVVFVFCSFGSG